MRCRHFTIRLTSQHTQDDEARLNAFLQSVRVHTVQTAGGAPGCWSVLVFYQDLASQGGQAKEATGQEAQQSAASAPASSAEPPQATSPALSPEEQYIYERLREWRSQRASADGKPPYVIANNAVLMHIAKHHMSIRIADDLIGISQFGPARAARYGPDILQLLYRLAARDEAPLFADER